MGRQFLGGKAQIQTIPGDARGWVERLPTCLLRSLWQME